MTWLRMNAYLAVAIGCVGAIVSLFAHVMAMPAWFLLPVTLIGLIGVAVDDIRKKVA